MSKMSILTYNRANIVIVKNAIILNNIQNILRDTEVVICIILVILKRVSGLNHYFDIIYYSRPTQDIIVKQYSTLNWNLMFYFSFIIVL